jgi:cytidine diphosphoramidate kinase
MASGLSKLSDDMSHLPPHDCGGTGITNAPIGTTYWITGLPGSGKTTIARLLCARLRSAGSPAILIDGDRMREILGGTFGYGRAERETLSGIYGRWCQELNLQGTDAVCATVSMFEAARQWNRRNLDRYREIYLRVPFSVLRQRDPKTLYANAAKGRINDIPGLDQPFEEPCAPDIVIDNGDEASPAQIVERLFVMWIRKG